ncbi:unnamed protein product, partial [Dibothriocephalus latus]
VTVLSVSPSSDRCSCETESGRHLKDVRIRDIQTVVPRHRGERTMIVRGQYAEEMGKLVDRIDKTSTARIYLLSSGKEIVVPFDDVCMLATVVRSLNDPAYFVDMPCDFKNTSVTCLHIEFPRLEVLSILSGCFSFEEANLGSRLGRHRCSGLQDFPA